MHSLDTHLLTFLLVTRFAEAYSQGSYGSGGYNETDSTTSTTDQTAPAQSGTTVQSPETITAPDDQTSSPTSETTQNSTVQPSKTEMSTDSPANAGLDPVWIIVIGAGIIVAVLATVFTVIAKKLRNP